MQVRQAVTIGAWLRYPTATDAALVHLVGPGGADGLDRQADQGAAAPEPWRSWVDEVVVSWAACILVDTSLARAAAEAAADTEHARGLSMSFRSLLEPDAGEIRASALLRHPDLMEPVARMHRDELYAVLRGMLPSD